MFKKFTKLVIGIIFISTFLAVSSVYIITTRNWKRYHDSFVTQANKQVDFYLNNLIEDMTFAIESHAYWTESIEYLNKQDAEWLYDNATGYIIDMGLFSTDYILVADETKSFVQESGDVMQDSLLNDDRILSTLADNTVNVFYKRINNHDALIYASPFLDNNLENPTGLYLCASYLDANRMNELSSMLAGDLNEIVIGENFEVQKSSRISKDIVIGKEILNSEKFLILRFNVEKMYRMFYLQRNYTFLIVLFSGFCVAGIIVFLVFRITKRLKQLTHAIKDISEGDYENVISFKRNDYLYELNQLTDAVNKMSKDISNHILTIDANYEEMVNVIINAVEINDAYTSRHNIEVGNYARIIAEEIDYEHIDDLIMASKLHDIGKISIPGSILNKPGKLTEKEYEIIKIHPSKGYQIIEHLDYFNRIKLGVKYHHEHFDGSGYPEGLKGDEIPMIAQIIAIADVYDAVTSDRSYRKGMSHSEAIKIIKEKSGIFFNPSLVDAFLRRTEDFKILMIENRARHS